MSHEIESNRFAYRESSAIPWHVEPGGIRDNKVPDADCYSIERFMQTANMAVTYEKVPVTLLNSPNIVPGLFAIRRIEDGHIIPNCGVGSKYNLLQPLEAFQRFQPFLDTRQAILDTAGILRSGSRFFINAEVQNSSTDILPGDSIRGNLLFYTSVDGTLVTSYGFFATRVVCANTARQAMLEAVDSSNRAARIRVKHTPSQRLTLDKINDILDFQTRSFSATVDQYRALTKLAAIPADLDKYVRLVLDFPSEEESSTKANNIVESVIDLANTGAGTDIPGVRGTAWGAYNAMTEYLNHNAGRNEWTRQDSLLFGEYSKLTEKALTLATEVFA